MDNLPAKITAQLPAPTPCATASMSSEECADHRSRIGFEVEIVLQGYWQDQLSPQMKTAVIADWADELEDWPVEQVRWGLREWRRENPRRKPNPGDILAVLKRKRGEEYAAKIRKLPKADNVTPIVSDEARARNLKLIEEYGFAVKRMPKGGAE